MDVIEEVGVHVTRDPVMEGYWRVSCFVRAKDGVRQTNFYDHLSWTEVIDVTMAVQDENRPGDAHTNWCVQPALW